MINVTMVVLAAGIGFLAGNFSGYYYYARVEVWWTKKKMGWNHVGDLVKIGAGVMLVVFVLGVGGLKYLGVV